MAGLGLRAKAAARAVVGVFSEQSARQAYGMLAGIFPGGMGLPPVRGTKDYLRAYSTMPWLRAVSARVASRVATAEWELYVAKREGAKARRATIVQRAYGPERRRYLKALADDGELVRLDAHPMLDLLHDANSFQTGESMRKVTQLHLDLVGEAFWLKERDGLGMPVAVWPIPPDWVIATPTPTNRFFRVQFRGWRGLIPDTEFMWFVDPDPSNPYGRGTGTAQALADELETDEYVAKHTKAFFYNRARPDLVVWPKNGQMREPDVRRLEEDWLARTQGFWKAFKPYFATREIGIHEMDQNFRSQQLVQLREYERDTVLQTFGVPPEILGVLDNSNRATILAADTVFSRYVVEPRLEFLRSAMQERLVPEFDERLILSFASPVQEDKEFQLDVSKAAPWTRNMNEWRELAGLSPVDDPKIGELYFVPININATPPEEITTPVPIPGASGPVVDEEPVKPKPKPKPTIEDEDEEAEARAWRSRVREAADVCHAAGDSASEAWMLKALADADDLPELSAEAARFEARTARDVAAALSLASESVSESALHDAIAAGQPDASLVVLLNPSGENERLRQALEPRLVEVGLRGAHVGAAAVGVTIDGGKQLHLDLTTIEPAVAAYARAHAAALMNATPRTQARVRALVVRAAEEGWSPRELARMLKGVVGLTEQQADAVANFRARLRESGVAAALADARTAKYATAQRRARALTIARTELIAAANGGQQALWEESARRGLIDRSDMRRVWIATMDERLESVCEALDGQTAGLNEPFDGGFDHPPAHPRCRCAVGLARDGRRR